MPLRWLESARIRLTRWAPEVLVAIATLSLAINAIGAILEKTGGVAAVPLDDTFIHFQFARSFAEGRPFVYSPGAPPTPGATSLLWPVVLAPFQLLGFRGLRLIWVAWTLNFLSLGLLAWDTARLARGLLSRECAAAAGAMVLTFGGYTWCAGSGMEVVPLAWLLIRSAALASEWREADTPARRRTLVELCAVGGLVALLRPEGAIGSVVVAATLIAWPRGRSRVWAFVVLAAPLVPGLVNALFTGGYATTTARVKWLLFSPYPAHVPGVIRYHVDLLFNTLLDGRLWSAVFVPEGGKHLAWAALPALVIEGRRSGRSWRAAATLLVALGVLIPATYDSFLVNRLRYLWPFAAGWFVALASLAELLGHLLARVRAELGIARTLIAGAFAGAFAGHLSFAIDDLAASASAIHRQQVSLALWAREALPAGSVIGLNDAGAIAYLSGHRTFDVVGLTTAGEGTHWANGPGSRFEHYERLKRVDRAELPTHFIVYERWFAIDAVLGEYLTERSVPGATILGDTTKTAYTADWGVLGSGERPRGTEERAIIDAVDVADLESEREHQYAIFFGQQQDNLVLDDGAGRFDGARRARTVDRFELELAPGGDLRARVASSAPMALEVRVHGRRIGELELTGNPGWEEPSVKIPAELAAGRCVVEVVAPAGTSFASLHYWSTR